MCKVDVNGRVIAVDQRFCRMLRRRRASLIGQRYLDLLCSEDRSVDVGLTHRAAPEGRHWHAEVRYRLKTGAPVWAVVYGSWAGAPEDPHRYWLSASVDISERKHAEQALKSSESRLSAIFDYSPVGLCEISMQGEFLRVNGELCKMLGRSRDELLGMNVTDITHPEDVEHTKAALAHLTETGIPSSIDKRYLRADGAVIFANSSLSLPEMVAEQPQVILAVTVDLTERQRIQAELMEDLEAGKRLQAISTQLISRGGCGCLVQSPDRGRR